MLKPPANQPYRYTRLAVYADGSSHGRQGLPGGYGFVVLDSGEKVLEGNGGHACTSNNRMELTGAIEGLKAAARWALQHCPDALDHAVLLHSDSMYVVNIANGTNVAVANLDLVTRLRALVLGMNVRAKWVKGHAGNRWNEECDRLAKSGKLTVMGAGE